MGPMSMRHSGEGLLAASSIESTQRVPATVGYETVFIALRMNVAALPYLTFSGTFALVLFYHLRLSEGVGFLISRSSTSGRTVWCFAMLSNDRT
jgi:hypothetical protein